jgi:hypothetical protein
MLFLEIIKQLIVYGKILSNMENLILKFQIGTDILIQLIYNT